MKKIFRHGNSRIFLDWGGMFRLLCALCSLALLMRASQNQTASSTGQRNWPICEQAKPLIGGKGIRQKAQGRGIDYCLLLIDYVKKRQEDFFLFLSVPEILGFWILD